MITQEQQDALERWRLKRAEIERLLEKEFIITDANCVNFIDRISVPDFFILANAVDDLLEQNKDLEDKLARMTNENKDS